MAKFAAAHIPHQAQISHLLALPLEIRCLIYEHVNPGHVILANCHRTKFKPFNLALVSRQIYLERIPVFYGRMTFVVEMNAEEDVSWLYRYINDCDISKSIL